MRGKQYKSEQKSPEFLASCHTELIKALIKQSHRVTDDLILFIYTWSVTTYFRTATKYALDEFVTDVVQTLPWNDIKAIIADPCKAFANNENVYNLMKIHFIHLGMCKHCPKKLLIGYKSSYMRVIQL